MDELKKINSILTTFSEEAQKTIFKKCEEFGFNPNRGMITLEESFINLNQIKAQLSEAIHKNKLKQLSLTIQNSILGDLENIALSQTNLINGSDEVINIVNTIDKLYTDIWIFGLHRMSDQLLGYMEKMNKLKHLEVQTAQYKSQLEQGLSLKDDLVNLLNEAKTATEQISMSVINAEHSYNAVKELETQSHETTNRINAIFPTIQQNEVNSGQLLASSQVSNAQISSIEQRISDFFDKTEEYKESIRQTDQNARTAIETNNNDTSALILRLKEMEDQIKDQLLKATGHSLFHSFQTRQATIASAKGRWIWGIVGCVLLTLILTGYIAHSTTNFDVAFFLKLSISLPLIFAIIFCSTQYTRERRLEEEYAFKSNISISLIPYKELVEKMVSTENEREKFTTFIIESINKVFTSPVSNINQNDPLSERNASQIADSLENLLKPVETVLKMIKK